jgi:hypothetical protein
MTPLGSAALELAAKGLRVFPCVERGKEPVFRDNLKRATIDPNIIAGWWRRRNFNVAVATGAESGIWVLDIDGVEGEALLRQLEAEHSSLPPTVEAITGDGRHLYFRWHVGCSIRNKQENPIMPEIDVRGEGGYVLAPPSMHPSGRRYAWSVDSAESYADAPEWLLDLVLKGRGGARQAQALPPEAWRSFIDEPANGSRRSAAIARLYGLLVRRFLDPIVALGMVRMFNQVRCQPPLAESCASPTI